MVAGAPRVGGAGEFDPWSCDLERDLLAGATGDGSVAIVATASASEGATYHEWIDKGLSHYAELGVAAHAADIRGREDATRDDVVAEISRASLVFMSGGDAAYLAAVLSGSPAWEAMRDLLERGGAIAGGSAGAMVLGEAAPPNMLTDVRWRTSRAVSDCCPRRGSGRTGPSHHRSSEPISLPSRPTTS